jgi:hypothetical protein
MRPDLESAGPTCAAGGFGFVVLENSGTAIAILAIWTYYF